jgi:hypothetical protein
MSGIAGKVGHQYSSFELSRGESDFTNNFLAKGSLLFKKVFAYFFKVARYHALRVSAAILLRLKHNLTLRDSSARRPIRLL